MTDLQTNQSAATDLIMYGDLSKLDQNQRMQYLAKLCETMGLNPLTKPFEFMQLQGKIVCYAGRNCAEQLRKVHNVSLKITSRETISDVYIVTVEASVPDRNKIDQPRVDGATGAVPIAGLKGNDLANAMMKAETKAKRRATLSICSLGMMDEMEAETIHPPMAVRPEQPGIGNGNTEVPPDVIIYGKYASKRLDQIEEELGLGGMRHYRDFLRNETLPITRNPDKKFQIEDTVNKFSAHITYKENYPTEEEVPNE